MALTLTETVEAAVRALGFDLLDAAVVEDAAASVGRIDPLLGDQVAYDQVSVAEAAERPLERSAGPELPEPGVVALSFVETLALPSGRVLQIARRFPTERELDAFLEDGTAHQGPALRLRELLVPGVSAAAVREQVPLLDAATVRAVPPGGLG